jgi:IclR family transcriptional regulator, acetate operon repressor
MTGIKSGAGMGDNAAVLPAVAATPKGAGRLRETRPRTDKTERAPDKLSATGRSFAILEHVALAQTPVDVVDIIGALNLPKATAYRLVDWFVTQGFLSREPSRKRLVVGPRFTRLAFGALVASMRDTARHIILQRLVATINETCNVGTLVNGEIVYLDRVEAEHWPLRLQFTVGSRMPLHCTAIGKLFLALAPPRQRRGLLGCLELKRFTEHTITSGPRLEEELKQIRREGVAFDRQEFLVGVTCVAVPITGADGDILAAVAIQAPEARMPLDIARRHLPLLRRAAIEFATTFELPS